MGLKLWLVRLPTLGVRGSYLHAMNSTRRIVDVDNEFEGANGSFS